MMSFHPRVLTLIIYLMYCLIFQYIISLLLIRSKGHPSKKSILTQNNTIFFVYLANQWRHREQTDASDIENIKNNKFRGRPTRKTSSPH